MENTQPTEAKSAVLIYKFSSAEHYCLGCITRWKSLNCRKNNDNDH